MKRGSRMKSQYFFLQNSLLDIRYFLASASLFGRSLGLPGILFLGVTNAITGFFVTGSVSEEVHEFPR